MLWAVLMMRLLWNGVDSGRLQPRWFLTLHGTKTWACMRCQLEMGSWRYRYWSHGEFCVGARVLLLRRNLRFVPVGSRRSTYMQRLQKAGFVKVVRFV